MITLHGDTISIAGEWEIVPSTSGWIHGISMDPMNYAPGVSLLVELTTPENLPRLLRVGFSQDALFDYPFSGLLVTDTPNLKANEFDVGERKTWQLTKYEIGPATRYTFAIEMVVSGFIFWAKGGAYGELWAPLWRSNLMPSGEITPVVASARLGTVTRIHSIGIETGVNFSGTILSSGFGKMGFHGPSLTTDGTRLVAHWQEGADHRAADTVVKHAVSDDNGATWGAPVVVGTSLPGRWISHGVVGYAAGKWWLFVIDMSAGPPHESDRTLYATSTDGIAWSSFVDFAPGTGRLLVFNQPKEWNGAIYLGGTRGISPHRAVVFRSTNGGQTWQECAIPESVDEMEPELVPRTDRLSCYLRTSLGHLRVSHTFDGITWTPSSPTQWPNPDSRVTWDDGRFTGNWDHVAANPGMGRNTLAVWNSSATLLRRADTKDVSLAYPSICGSNLIYSYAQRSGTTYSMICFRKLSA